MATLTRQELYDLVWSHPRTELAARLGVSDVAIGKVCARANIPAPPRGYWARLESGQGQHATPLPLRLPGQPSTIHVGTDNGASVEAAADRALGAPTFTEDVDAQVAAALARLPGGWLRFKLNNPHQALRRVLASETRRQASAGKTGWPTLGPHLSSAEHQRQLSIFNRLSHALGAVWNYLEVRIDEEWRQGMGTTYHLRLHCGFVVHSASFAFLDPRLRQEPYRKDLSGPPVLYFTADREGRYDAKWEDAAGTRLETQLPRVVETTLRNEELALRQWQMVQYQQAVEDMAAAQRARAAAELERQRREEEKAAAAEQSRRDDLATEAARWHQAAQIRAYIAHLDAHGAPDAEWRAWALRVADETDPTEKRITADRKAETDERK